MEDGVAHELVVKGRGVGGDGRGVGADKVRDRVTSAVTDQAEARLQRVSAGGAVDKVAAAVKVSVQGEDPVGEGGRDDAGTRVPLPAGSTTYRYAE